MKFLAPLAILAAGTVAADPLVQRGDVTDATDTTAITAVVNVTFQALQVWDTAILAYSGGDSADLKSVTFAMSATVTKAITDAKALANLDLKQAESFKPIIQFWIAANKQFAEDFESKMSILAKEHLCQLLLEQWIEISDKLLTLTRTLVSKLPKECQAEFDLVIKSLEECFAAIKTKLKACASQSTTSTSTSTSTTSSTAAAKTTTTRTSSTSTSSTTWKNHNTNTTTSTSTKKPSSTCTDEDITSSTSSMKPETPCTKGCKHKTSTSTMKPADTDICTETTSSTSTPSSTCTETWTTSTSTTGGPVDHTKNPCTTCSPTSSTSSTSAARSASTSLVTAGAAPTKLPVGGVVAFALLPLLW